MSEESAVERGVDFPPTELPSQQIVHPELHHKLASNAEDAAYRADQEPELAEELKIIGKELHEIADAGEKPLDHVSPEHQGVAEGAEATGRFIDDTEARERPITFGDFQEQTELSEGGSVVQLPPDDPEMEKRVRILESILGVDEGDKHEVPTDEKGAKVVEAKTSIHGVNVVERVDKQGKIRISVGRKRMQPPPVRLPAQFLK